LTTSKPYQGPKCALFLFTKQRNCGILIYNEKIRKMQKQESDDPGLWNGGIEQFAFF